MVVVLDLGRPFRLRQRLSRSQAFAQDLHKVRLCLKMVSLKENLVRTFRSFDDLQSAVGAEVGTSEWVEVTQDRIDKFAAATGDDQWIHVDVNRAARELPTKTTIAHGLLTLSFAPFVRSVIGLKGIKNTLNYGANRIRYLAPVPAGSRLRGRISIVHADDAPSNGLRVTYGITIEIEGRDRPACVAEMIAIHYL